MFTQLLKFKSAFWPIWLCPIVAWIVLEFPASRSGSVLMFYFAWAVSKAYAPYRDGMIALSTFLMLVALPLCLSIGWSVVKFGFIAIPVGVGIALFGIWGAIVFDERFQQKKTNNDEKPSS